MEQHILLTNIQRSSFHDGPGIRTTVFLKGCSLHCPWCCNPENLEYKIQPYIKDGKEDVYGQYMTTEELYTLLSKDKAFYGIYRPEETRNLEELPGGITFSGGEALLQIEALIPLLKRLKTERIHVAVESCLFIPSRLMDIALNYIDLFYVDVKLLDDRRCQEYLGGDLTQFYYNIDRLFSSFKPVVLRIPVIGGFTDNVENRTAILNFIKNITPKDSILKVELMKGHHLGDTKYRTLMQLDNRYKMPMFKEVSDKMLDMYRQEIDNYISNEILVEVCRV